MYTKNSRNINILVLLALFMGGFSPACHLVSGNKDGLVICGIFGTKTVYLPSGDSPFDNNEQESDRYKDQCPFCFLYKVLLTKMSRDSFALGLPISGKTPAWISENQNNIKTSYSFFHDIRGPPWLADDLTT